MRDLHTLIFSIGHPSHLRGGADGAARALFRKLNQRTGTRSTFVAAAAPSLIGNNAPFGLFEKRADEILWTPPPVDRFRQLTQYYDKLRRDFAQLYEVVRPDVVHFAHHLPYGADLIEIVSRDFNLPTVLTFNEYSAICNNFGQMAKTDGRLCHFESFSECSACFPEIPAGHFFLRKLRLASIFRNHIDRFIAPSEIVLQRHLAWGMPEGRFAKIPYIQTPELEQQSMEIRREEASEQFAKEGKSNHRLKIGFFGRVNPFKGVDLLLEALDRLSSEERAKLHVDIYGPMEEAEPDWFVAKVTELCARHADCVTMHGAYEPADVVSLMRAMDWVVVPSIWWEVGPIVIEEAAIAGRPVLCSDIGGMAEKVRPGENGLQFRTNSVDDLATKLSVILAGQAQIAPEPIDSTVWNVERLDAFCAVYEQVIEERRARGGPIGGDRR